MAELKINCIVRSSIEFENGFEQEVVAYDVDLKETVGDLMDRLVGRSTTRQNEIIRHHNFCALVELRVAMPNPDEDKP